MIHICLVVCEDCLKREVDRSKRLTLKEPTVRDLLAGMWVACRYCLGPRINEASKIIMEFN